MEWNPSVHQSKHNALVCHCERDSCNQNSSFQGHLENCRFKVIKCNECDSTFRRDKIQKHKIICAKLDTYTGICYRPNTSGIKETSSNCYTEAFFRSLHVSDPLKADIARALECVIANLREDQPHIESLIYDPPVDGMMKWKISNFRSRKYETQHGFITRIYSPDFYTSEGGYRMRLCLYVDGHKEGTNSHVSLFLVIMQGKHDDLLTWPVKLSVSFALLNMSNGEDQLATFERGFNRPFMEQSEQKDGFVQFVGQQYVENNYIKEGAIFIKCMCKVQSQ